MNGRTRHRLAWTLLAVLPAILLACGGDSDRAPAVAENAVTVGTIARFGSIVTNNVTWRTDRASVRIDGIPGTLSDLGVGDVVAVTGDLAASRLAGVAARVELRHAVQGPITSIDRFSDAVSSGFSDELVIEVLGQWIVLDNSTIYGGEINPAAPEGLTVGDTVSVTGFPGTVLVTRAPPELGFSVFTTYDAWHARRIEKRPGLTPLIVSGIAGEVDDTARRFAVGELTIDYSGVTPGPGPVADEASLWVKGDRLGPSGELIASEILAISSPVDGLEPGAWVDVQGRFENRAGSILEPPDIEIGGVPIEYQYPFPGGSDGGIFRAQGLIGENGQVAGTPVDVVACSAFALRVRAPVDAVDVAGLALVILGQRIEVTTGTHLHDQRGTGRQQVGFADLVAGEWLDVRACEWVEAVPGALIRQWVGTVVERVDPAASAEVTGRTGPLVDGQLVMRQVAPSPALVIQVSDDTVFVSGSRPPYVPEPDPAGCLGPVPGGGGPFNGGSTLTAIGVYSGSGVLAATEVRIRACAAERPINLGSTISSS